MVQLMPLPLSPHHLFLL